MELTELNRSSGGAVMVDYTVPFNVDAGDRLYIDQLGSIRKQPHTVESAVRTGVGGNWSSHNMLHNFFRKGYSAGFWFSYALQNGNTLVVQGGGTQSTAIYFVFSPEFRILNSGTFSIAGITVLGNDYYLGCFEVSANNFRFYMITSNTASDANAALQYRTITYNPSTHLVTSGSPVQILDDGFILSANFSSLFAGQRKNGRYVPVQANQGSSASRFYLLDMQNSTLVRYSALDSAAFQNYIPLDVDTFSAGSEYSIVRSTAGGLVRVCKAGSDISAAVPASVSSLFTGVGFIYRCIAQGAWIVMQTSGGSGAYLVKFSSDYSSAVISNIFSTAPVDLDSPAPSDIMVFTDGTRYWLHTGVNRPVVSFLWNGSVLSNPTLETSFNGSDRAVLNSRGAHLVSAADQMISSARMDFSGTSHAFIRFSPAELFPHAITEFGVCMASAFSGQPVEIELSSSSDLVQSQPAMNVIGLKLHQDVLTRLSVRAKFMELHAARATSAGSTRADASDWPMLNQAIVGKSYPVSGSFVAKTGHKVKTMIGTSHGSNTNYILQWLGVHGSGSFVDFGSDGTNGYAVAVHISNHAPMVIYNSTNTNAVAEEAL